MSFTDIEIALAPPRNAHTIVCRSCRVHRVELLLDLVK